MSNFDIFVLICFWKHEICVFLFISNLSFRIIELNGGQPPLTYKRFQTLISHLDPPEMPVETLSDTLMGSCITPISEDHGEKYGVPSLEELGEKTSLSTRSHQNCPQDDVERRFLDQYEGMNRSRWAWDSVTEWPPVQDGPCTEQGAEPALRCAVRL